MSLRPEPIPARQRWTGIRAQLLLLLLPLVALVLTIDSWGDHEVRLAIVDSAYDEALLEPIFILDRSVHIDAKGEVDLTVPFAVRAMFESVPALHKQLHLGLIPLDGVAGAPLAERNLLGVDDLPAPPADAKSEPAPASFGNAQGSRIIFYTAPYGVEPMRIATMQRDLQDAAGRHYRLRVQAAQSMERRLNARETSLRHELEQDLAVLGTTALLIWFGISWALRPLKRLRASLRERPAHDLQPLDAGGVPYEVAPLVDAVNHHIADHRQVLDEQGRFLTDASHQLRTPLAIMMTQAGYAMREQDPEILRESLRAIIAQLGRSQRLTDQLLSMAHASRAVDDATPAPIADLNAVAREVVLQYLPLAHAKNLDLGWDDIRGEDAPEGAGTDAPAAPVRAQPAELHEALANLVHNAINHTPANGTITVAVRIDGDQALAEVSDSGPGISPVQREAVFERFSRGVPEAGGSTRSAGLGLAIARAYARRNGGDIVLADVADAPAGGTGLCARLSMPLAKHWE